MHRIRRSSYLVLLTAVLLLDCASATRRDDDAGIDGSPDSDVSDADEGSDAAPTEVELRGWHLELDGHRLFLPEDAVEEELIADLCHDGLSGLPLVDAYWVEASHPEDLLTLFPNSEPTDGAIGLVEIEGLLTPRGHFGPDGSYDHELSIESEELLLCPTVSVLGHCAVPQRDTRYACIFGRDPDIWGEEPLSLSDLFSFGVNDVLIIEGSVLMTLELVGDYYNMAMIEIEIESPAWTGEGPDETFEVFEFPNLSVRELSEVHRHPTEGVTFEAQFTEDHSGWIMRRRTVGDGSRLPAFFLSIAGATLDGETIYLWASFPAIEVGEG